MEIGKSIIITDTIGKIQKYMETIGKTGWIMNLEDNSVLMSVYFLDTSKRVDGEKVIKLIAGMEKKLGVRCKSYSIGKTVSFYLEV